MNVGFIVLVAVNMHRKSRNSQELGTAAPYCMQ